MSSNKVIAAITIPMSILLVGLIFVLVRWNGEMEGLQSRFARVEADNAKLVADKVQPVQPQPVQSQSIQSAAVDSFNAFIEKFVPAFDNAQQKEYASQQAFFDKAHAASFPGVKDDITNTLTTGIVSTDLVNSDSIPFPIQGVATVTRRTEANSETYMRFTITEYKIRFGFSGGKWKVIKINSRIASALATIMDKDIPNSEGLEMELPPSWLDSTMSMVQQ